MSAVIDQLLAASRDLKLGVAILDGMQVTEAEFHELITLVAYLKEVVDSIEKRTGSFSSLRSAKSWRDSQEMRNNAQETIAVVLRDDKFAKTTFKNNVRLIFQGPQRSELDTPNAKHRKTTTGNRCDRLKQLSPDGIVAWAIAYPVTSWNPTKMTNDIFDCLLKDIEPKDTKAWPAKIGQILSGLSSDLPETPGLKALADAINDPSRHAREGCDYVPSIAPVRQGLHNEPAPQERPRVPKSMFANAPPGMVQQLPQPFRGAVLNSGNWKLERSRGDPFTSCITTIFPEDPKQDVGLTLWCGHNDGYRLNDIYRLTMLDVEPDNDDAPDIGCISRRN